VDGFVVFVCGMLAFHERTLLGSLGLGRIDPHAVCDYLQSGERILGRSNLQALRSHHPGKPCSRYGLAFMIIYLVE
jgi:hypothetical protein